MKPCLICIYLIGSVHLQSSDYHNTYIHVSTYMYMSFTQVTSEAWFQACDDNYGLIVPRKA